MLGTAAGCGRIRRMKRDSRQYRAAMEWQRRVLGPGERTLSPVCVGLGWGCVAGCAVVEAGGKGGGEPGMYGQGGGRRREEGADWTKVECREKIRAPYGGGCNAGSLPAAMASYAVGSVFFPIAHAIFLPCIIRVQNRTIS